MKPNIKIEGVAPLLRRLEAIKKSLKNKAERKMVTKGSVPIQKAAKAKAPRRTKTGGITVVGTLKKSLGKRVKRGRAGYIAVVGPRLGHRRQIGVRIGRQGRRASGALRGEGGRFIAREKLVPKTGAPIMHDPAKIAHLVEKGHGGPHAAGAHAFMEPALQQGAPEAQRIMQEVAWAEIQKAR